MSNVDDWRRWRGVRSLTSEDEDCGEHMVASASAAFMSRMKQRIQKYLSSGKHTYTQERIC